MTVIAARVLGNTERRKCMGYVLRGTSNPYQLGSLPAGRKRSAHHGYDIRCIR